MPNLAKVKYQFYLFMKICLRGYRFHLEVGGIVNKFLLYFTERNHGSNLRQEFAQAAGQVEPPESELLLPDWDLATAGSAYLRSLRGKHTPNQ